MIKPPDKKIDNKELLAKSKRKIKKSPKNLESRSREFKKLKLTEKIAEKINTPVYPRLIKASPIIPVFAC